MMIRPSFVANLTALSTSTAQTRELRSFRSASSFTDLLQSLSLVIVKMRVHACWEHINATSVWLSRARACRVVIVM